MTEEQLWQMGSLIVGTGLISVIWTSVWTVWVDRKKRRLEAVNVALRAAIALERYAIACWPALYSGGEHYQRTGQPFFDHLPAFAGLPADDEWAALQTTLADRALSFANRLDISTVISTHAKVLEDNPFDTDTEAQNLGKAAWSIAADLRKFYRLPPQEQMKKSLKALLE